VAVIIFSDSNTILDEIEGNSICNVFISKVDNHNCHVWTSTVSEGLVNVVASALGASLDTDSLVAKTVLVDSDELFVSDEVQLSLGKSAEIATKDKWSFSKGPESEMSLLLIW